jgi:hypothetical protein
MAPAERPDVLTIEEAARVLRIGRTAAYQQARLWRVTGGEAGLPNFALGHTFRVPTASVEELVGHPVSAVPDRRRVTEHPPDADGGVRRGRPRNTPRATAKGLGLTLWQASDEGTTPAPRDA